jgi:hypothetical protein
MLGQLDHLYALLKTVMEYVMNKNYNSEQK